MMKAALRQGGACLLILGLAGCGNGPEANGTVIVSAPEPVPSATEARPGPAPDQTVRLPPETLQPRPLPSDAPAEPVPHRNFKDPPLPPELEDDGGLKPLPPRPR